MSYPTELTENGLYHACTKNSTSEKLVVQVVEKQEVKNDKIALKFKISDGFTRMVALLTAVIQEKTHY